MFPRHNVSCPAVLGRAEEGRDVETILGDGVAVGVAVRRGLDRTGGSLRTRAQPGLEHELPPR